MTYPNGLFSALSFLGFVLSVIPFPWHFEAWNTGTCLFMAWTGVACMNQFINSVLWTGNVLNWSPVWCDISSRIIVGVHVAIPAATLCINRRLYLIASVRSVTISQAEKRRAVMVDLSIGLGIPLLMMALQYIPQGHRFDIWEDVGCFPFTYNTIVAVLLMDLPVIVLGLVSGFYSFLSIRSFVRLRSQFQEILSGHNKLNTSRYLRLIILSSVDIACTIPLGLCLIAFNVSHLEPWVSWADTHAHFSRIRQIPASAWRGSSFAPSLEFNRWMNIVFAILFFFLFGFAEEARKNYRLAVSTVAKYVGGSSFSAGSSSASATGSKRSFLPSTKAFNGSSRSGGVLPVFVKRDVLSKRDSIASFTDGSGSITHGQSSMHEKTPSSSSSSSSSRQHTGPIEFSYDSLVLPDVGGALSDHKPSPHFPPEDESPFPSSPRPDSLTIEVSSVRFSRNMNDSPSVIQHPREAAVAPKKRFFPL